MSDSDNNQRAESSLNNLSMSHQNGQRLRERIQAYFKQLTVGCGNPSCDNVECISCPNTQLPLLSRNEAAARALTMNSKNARCCSFEHQPASIGDTERLTDQPQTSTHLEASNNDAPRGYLGALEAGDDEFMAEEIAMDVNQSDTDYPYMDARSHPRTSDIGMSSLDDIPGLRSSHYHGEMPSLRSLHGQSPPTSPTFLHHYSGPFGGPSRSRRHDPAEDEFESTSSFNILSHLLHRPSRSSGFRHLLSGHPDSSSSSPQDVERRLEPRPPYIASLTSVEYLTEEKLESVIAGCETAGNWAPLIRILGKVFSAVESLTCSFLHTSIYQKANQIREKADTEMSEKRAPADVQAQGDASNTGSPRHQEVPVDAQDKTDERDLECPVDLESLRRAMTRLFALEDKTFCGSMETALSTVCRTATIDLKNRNIYESQPDYLNVFIILFELPLVLDPSFFEKVLPPLCQAAAALPVKGQAELCRVWSRYKTQDSLVELHKILMQLMTIWCLTTEWECSSKGPNGDEKMGNVARVMKMIYYTSLLAGQRDPASLIHQEGIWNEQFDRDFNEYRRNYSDHFHSVHQMKEDPLSKELEISPNDVRKPVIPCEEFVNETLNDVIKPETDYRFYRNSNLGHSFFNFPFLLTTHTKSILLKIDNKTRMYEERRDALYQTFVDNIPQMPYLKLRISRDRVVEDALLGLEIATMENPGDLKKQLFIEFDGEQGIDEGGVSKEFFQLIIEKIFNPDYGMFTFDEDTNTFWFNPVPVDDLDREYTLIGIVLGLAIYNNIILDIRFPSVLYRKLSGKLGTLNDLKESHPTLGRSLQELLDFDGDNLEEVFSFQFLVSYKDMFGNQVSHVLKPGGENISVTKENRLEFVNLYADFLLNSSIKRQFRAFRRGFQMVVGESPLKDLFRPEEIELLVCGSNVYDFTELERVTEYENDYTDKTEVIRHFWSVVHDMTDSQRRDLLQFCTGTDRVPLGGMKNMKFIIAKQGPDTNRLPTAHTCFNILLLPEYSSREKLEKCLHKAITYSKGFGML